MDMSRLNKDNDNRCYICLKVWDCTCNNEANK